MEEIEVVVSKLYKIRDNETSKFGDKFSIFFYGIEGFWRLSKILFEDQLKCGELRMADCINIIANNSKGATLKGFQRVFTDYSPKWKSSIATIRRSKKGDLRNNIAGINLHITQTKKEYYLGQYRIKFCNLFDIKRLDDYIFIPMEVTEYSKIDHSEKQVNSWISIFNKKCAVNVEKPSDKYLNKIRRLILDRRFLIGNADRSTPKLKICLFKKGIQQVI